MTRTHKPVHSRHFEPGVGWVENYNGPVYDEADRLVTDSDYQNEVYFEDWSANPAPSSETRATIDGDENCSFGDY